MHLFNSHSLTVSRHSGCSALHLRRTKLYRSQAHM